MFMRLIYRWKVAVVIMLLSLVSSPSNSSRQVDFCKVFGSVYVEDSAEAADYRVYKDNSEAFCDIKVFKVDSRVYADQQGLWHFTKIKALLIFQYILNQTKVWPTFRSTLLMLNHSQAATTSFSWLPKV
jgi:hypothetical protein